MSSLQGQGAYRHVRQLRGHGQGARVRLTWLNEDGLAICVTQILHLVNHGWENWCRASRNLSHLAFFTDRSNLELAVDKEIHRVDRVLVRQVLGLGREAHLDKAPHVLNFCE